MAIPDLYINRNKTYPDVFQHLILPVGLKYQIIHIFRSALEQHAYNELRNDISTGFIKIAATLAAELKQKSIIPPHGNPIEALFHFFEFSDNVDICLSFIEIILRLLKKSDIFFVRNGINITYPYKEIEDDVNVRFRQNGIGFVYEGDIIIRMDNDLLHQEAIRPALHYLSNPDYKNANNEFLNAHEHFRFNRYSECLVECNKAFESTMKIICSKNGWATRKELPQAKDLVGELFKNNFFAKFHESQLGGLKCLLESSISTNRNKYASHGKGIDEIHLTEHLTSYTLYMTGSTVRFLIETQMGRG